MDVVELLDNQVDILRTYLRNADFLLLGTEVGPGNRFPLVVRGLSWAGLVLPGELGMVPSLRIPGIPLPGARPPRQQFSPCINKTALS